MKLDFTSFPLNRIERMNSSESSITHSYIIEDVISKSRNELVYNGELKESVLSQLQSIWKRKMIQAGVISGTIESSSFASIPTPTLDPNSLLVKADNSTLTDIDDVQLPRSNPSLDLLISPKIEGDGFYIPQQDGARDEYIVTKPNTSSPCDVDENEELLNEDDDEEDAIDDDTSIPHLVMCQFDNVKRSRKKSKWECKLKAGVMQINGKTTLFSEATGDFNF